MKHMTVEEMCEDAMEKMKKDEKKKKDDKGMDPMNGMK